MKRLPFTDAFVDESVRGQRYVMACVLVEARHLALVRRTMTTLVGGGRRLHFHQELDSTRRRALDLIASLPLRVMVVVCTRQHGVSQFQARDACLVAIVHELQDRAVPRLVIESRQDDRDDERTIVRSRAAEPALTFDHVPGGHEPILWVADAVAWSHGAGGQWAPYVDRIVDQTLEHSP